MSLLTIIQSVCGRLSLPVPSVVVTSTDQLVQQLYTLANEEGASLAKRGDWQSLTAEWIFITVAQAEQTNTPIPPDLRKFLSGSFFNRTTVRQMVGPLTPQQWQLFQARPAAAYTYLAFRERQGTFLITPTPPAGESIAYEYISTNWAMSSADQGKTSFTSDDDTSFLDEELITLGIKWRFKAAKGLDYGEDMQTYERAVASALGENGAAAILNIGAPLPLYSPDRANLPEGGFGL